MLTARLVHPLRTSSNALTKSTIRSLATTPPKYNVYSAANKIGGMRVSTPASVHHTASSRLTGAGIGKRYVSSSAGRWQDPTTSSTTSTTTNTTNQDPASSNAKLDTPPPPPSPSKTDSAAKVDSTAKAENTKEEKGKEGEKAEVDKLKEEKDDLMSRLRYLQAELFNTQRIAGVEKDKMKDFAIVKFAGDLLPTVDTLEMALKSAAAASSTASGGVGGDLRKSGTSTGTSSGASSGTSSGTSSSDDDTYTFSTHLSHSHSHSSSASSSPPPTLTSSTVSSTPDDALIKGITLTHRLLLSTLASHGITPFTPTGEAFDPNWHEALFEVPLAVVRGMPEGSVKTDAEGSVKAPVNERNSGKGGRKDGGEKGKAEKVEVKPGMIVDTFKVGYRIKDRCLRAAQVGVVGE